MSSSRCLRLATRTQEAFAILSQTWPALQSDLEAARRALKALRTELLGEDFCKVEDPTLAGNLRVIVRRTTLVQTLCKSLQLLNHLPLSPQPLHVNLVIEGARDACNLLDVVADTLYRAPRADDPQAAALALQQVSLFCARFPVHAQCTV